MIEEVARKIETIETKLKFQAFGKTRPMTKLKTIQRLELGSPSASRMEGEEEISSKILKRQLEELEADLNKLKAEKHGTVTNVFKMAEIIGGAKIAKECY